MIFLQEFKNEIHDNLQSLVEKADKIKHTKRDFTFLSRQFDSEDNDNPPELIGLPDQSNILLNLNLQSVLPKDKKKLGMSPTPITEKTIDENKNEIPLVKSKYDFYVMNKQRWGVNQNNIIEVQKLPKEIDKIYQMTGESDPNIMRAIPLNFSEKRKIQAMMDDMKSFISNDDEIHTNSCVVEPLEEELKEANFDISIPFYLHLSSLSRELISNRKNPDDDVKYDQKVLDFLSETDYQISPDYLRLDDLFNILSGRISDKIVLRLFNGQEIHPLFEDFSEDNNINIKLPFEKMERSDKRESSKQKSTKSSISQDLVKLFQKKYSTRVGSSLLQKTPTFTSRSLQEIYDEIGYPLDQLQHEVIEMNSLVQNNFVSWQDGENPLTVNKIGGLNKIEEEVETSKEKIKKMIFGDNKLQTIGIQVDVGNEDKSSSKSDSDKKSEDIIEEDEFQGFRVPQKGFKKSVNLLLREISDLKEAKRNSMNMVNSQVMMKYIAEINLKIEQRLKTLLGLIMDKDLEEKEEGKEEQKNEEEIVEKENNLNNNSIDNENPNNINENRTSQLSHQITFRTSLVSKKETNDNKNEDESFEIVEDEAEVKRIKERDRMKEDLKKNLKTIVKDIDKLQGKYIDGHLKTKLLFQFLKEYRKLQEEKQQEKLMEMEESAIIKEDIDNPFDKNLENAMEKENQNEPAKFKRMDYKSPTMKNLKIANNKNVNHIISDLF